MLQRAIIRSKWKIKQFSSVVHKNVEDEGDWSYSSEWWGTDSFGHTVFRANSDKGNGVVSVVSYPSSLPAAYHWPNTERWIQQNYSKINPKESQNDQIKILGYQWRVLRFNDYTRQSAAKVMAVYRSSDPGSLFLMQQPHCLPVPYLRSMLSCGLTTLASCNYDLLGAIHGKKNMNILCVGHGGGSLPLFLASKIPGAIVHAVEIDPIVISASIEAMGFPRFSAKKIYNMNSVSKTDIIDQAIWGNLHDRIFLHESDAEQFILNDPNHYDIIFIDAYDGDDIFPRKLWDPEGNFLEAIKGRINPEHGTIVVNLHADFDFLTSQGAFSPHLYQILPMGRYVSQVCKAYKDVLIRGSSVSKQKEKGLAFVVSVPWVCNMSLIVCRGDVGIKDQVKTLDEALILNKLMSSSCLVENSLKLPFSCLEYIKRGFTVLN